ncbi:MAG: ABC transporter substrate-binding protein [Planctomycetota bacterium]|jgi:simple sugar transport system substrate-binding protein|nr:ABC transporter substrate-binding protein [Planctomycetota bacterium]
MRKLLASVLGIALAAAGTFAGEITVGFAQLGAESMWRTANTDSVKGEAARRGINLVFSDAQQKQENQIKAVRSFIAQGVDVIGLPPVVESGWEPVLREAQEAGIPVILTDRRVDTSDESLYTAFLGSNFITEGENAGNWLVRELMGRYGVVKGEVFELVGTVGAAPAIDRKKGFEAVIAKHPNLNIVKSQSGDFTRAKGKEVMEAFIKSPEWDKAATKIIYGHNDDMVLGAIQAIEEAGINPGKECIIIGVDAIADAFEAIAQGKMHCTVECNPLLGPQLFDMVEAVVAGKEVPKTVYSIEGTYDYYCAEALLPWRRTLY